MTRWQSEMTDQEIAIRNRVVAIIDKYTREMEGYDYFGSNPGVSEDDYEDVADEIIKEFGIK